MATKRPVLQSAEDKEPRCPLCLQTFNIPRKLPCMHSFCQHCLHLYISSSEEAIRKRKELTCPVCGTGTRPEDSSTSVNVKEWATWFPHDVILLSLLPASRVKPDRFCNACLTERVSKLAEGFCVVCKEALCHGCVNTHRKLKVSKTHSVISLNDMIKTPDAALKFSDITSCPKHSGETIAFYCKSHDLSCCGKCYLLNHRTCPEVTEIKKNLLSLLKETDYQNVSTTLKNLDSHIQNFSEINKANLKKVELEVVRLTREIEVMKSKITKMLDELLQEVKIEGYNTHKKEATRIQSANQQCENLKAAIRNSHLLLETVMKHGDDIQKFIITKHMDTQLSFYIDQVTKMCSKAETVAFELELDKYLISLSSQSPKNLGKLKVIPSSEDVKFERYPSQMKFEILSTALIKPSNKDEEKPWYTGGVFLTRSDRILMVDHFNCKCCLFDRSNLRDMVGSYTLSSPPWDTCAINEDEVAVSLPDQNVIQFLSINDETITPTKSIQARLRCYGLAAISKDRFIVSGYMDTEKPPCWGTLSSSGNEKSFHEFGSPRNAGSSFLVLNPKKTRVYVSLSSGSVYGFSVDGKKIFDYKSPDLAKPYGIAVDGYENVYILGYLSHKIHRLSDDGSFLQIFETGIPKYPTRILMVKVNLGRSAASKGILTSSEGIYTFDLKEALHQP
ncbi:hypothetical protein ACJMK2_040000 [Sinanodonta woodiana]|uniref:Uncharacterized protein n=1 Tax=Sinanodonta woodiana TaxID=1069815 RepID=A0ABD3WDM2_SINWO